MHQRKITKAPSTNSNIANVPTPDIHQLAASLEKIGPPISRFNPIEQFVRQRLVDDLFGKSRFLGGPIGETTAETVDRDFSMIQIAQHFCHGHVAERTLAGRRKNQAVIIRSQLPSLFEKRQHWRRKRNNMLLLHFHPGRWNGPYAAQSPE